jgi:hypothetical protein
MGDGLFCYVLLLACMGLFKLTAKHNLCYQCFLSLAKLLTSPEGVARALIANVTVSLTGRPFHNVGADEALEILQGGTKAKGGSKWSPARAVVYTACDFVLSSIKENFVRFGGDKNVEGSKGQHVKGAHADTLKLADALRPMGLFKFDQASPRTFAHLQVKSTYGRLFREGYKPPAAHIGAGHGGILNWTRRFSSSMPLFAAQVAAAQEFLERGGLVPRSQGTTEQAGAGAEDLTTHCELCASQLPTQGVRISCTCCDIVMCQGCTVERQEQFVCRICNECLQDEEAEAGSPE